MKPETILRKALEQCDRIAGERGLASRVRTFAVFHPFGARYDQALVLFRDDDGQLRQMGAWEFRLYLEDRGVVRLD
ncbi:hypothetical protein [Pseudomonas sp.]|uniref:hypothetical protein n=1 Tax=Pseudomonas sp. TaxID=306 RepID=UPI003D13D0A7